MTISLKIIDLETNVAQKAVLTPDRIGDCLVGRNPSCGIVLDDPLVSNVHGLFLQKENKWSYIDLLPTNSSYLNNTEIQIDRFQALKIRDSIYIGDSLLLVEDIQEIEVAPEAGIAQWTQDRLTVHCVGVIEKSHDVKTWRFVANPPVLFDYQPGQFMTLHLNIGGESVDRSYTISSTPSRPHTLEVTIKRVTAPTDVLDAPPGLVSNWLHDNLKVGGEIEVSSPMGDFTCADRLDRKILLISAGSGITPMMSMSRWAYDSAADLDIAFFHSARSTRDLIFHKELAWMSTQHPNFQLHLSLTQEQAGSNWSGLTGRFSAEMLKQITPDFLDRTVYVCGSEGFMQQVKNLFQSLSFPMDKYHQESFGASTPTAIPLELKIPSDDRLASSSPLVLFSKSGREILLNGEESILQGGKREKIRLKSACGVGKCGVCKIEKITGEVQYKTAPDRLSKQEQLEGFILPCIAYPVGRVEVEA